MAFCLYNTFLLAGWEGGYYEHVVTGEFLDMEGNKWVVRRMLVALSFASALDWRYFYDELLLSWCRIRLWEIVIILD